MANNNQIIGLILLVAVTGVSFYIAHMQIEKGRKVTLPTAGGPIQIN